MSELAKDLRFHLGQIARTNPNRPEVEPYRRMDDVKQDRRGQDEPAPSATSPTRNARNRQKRRQQQREHRGAMTQ